MAGKTKASTVLFLTGFLLCAYPLAGGFYEQIIMKKTVATYEEAIRKKKEKSRGELERAREYNKRLFQKKERKGKYKDYLDPCKNGVMGMIEIPKIKVFLPIYHGTSQEVLSSGTGHLEESSLPSGGSDTRCVLTGHRGLPGARLFTRLDEMKKGDLFYLHVCGRIMAYEVRSVHVIDPEDTGLLKIIKGHDLVSLVTCTPYGINTKRLVVTGERILYQKEEHARIRPGFLSGRELFFTSLPFIFLITTIVEDILEK